MNYWEPYGNIPKKIEKEGKEGQILFNLEPCPLGKDITFVISNNLG